MDAPRVLQEEQELLGFISAVADSGAKSYLEIGCRYGTTFRRVMSALPVGSRGVALDFPGGHFGDQESIFHLLDAVRGVRESGRMAHVVLGPSAAPEVVKRAAGMAPYDVILIDGDHRYEAVRRDWELYSPMGKMIVLHDVGAPEGLTSWTGSAVDVPRLWGEIKGGFRHTEIITPGSKMGFGIIWRD